LEKEKKELEKQKADGKLQKSKTHKKDKKDKKKKYDDDPEDKITIKFSEMTCKQYLASRFDLFPEALDLFEIIQERNIPKFIQKCIPILRRITGQSMIDVNMFESVFALSLGQHFNPSYLANKLNIPANFITFFVSLLRLAHPKYREEELARCITDLPFKVVCESRLKISVREFEGLFKLVFNIFDDDNSIASIIKELKVSDKIEIELFKGLVNANKPVDPFLNMFKNRIALDDLKTKTQALYSSLNLNPDLAFAFSRIGSGGFLIYREQRQLFDWLFPFGDLDREEATRNLLMGVCGVINPNVAVAKSLTKHCIHFELEYYPKKTEKFSITEPNYEKPGIKFLPDNTLSYANFLLYQTADLHWRWTNLFLFD